MTADSSQPRAHGSALRWLAHPVSVLAIVVLLLNDHVWKAAYGTWWTGKLSDVAGLVFAPALLAIALTAIAPRLTRSSAAAISVGAVGVVFAWVKLTDLGAATASAAWTAIAGPSVVLRDPTDLLALPALGVAWYAWRRTATRARANSATRRTLAAAVVLPVAVLATVATSNSEPWQVSGVQVVDGEVFAYTTTYLGTSQYGTWAKVSAIGELEDGRFAPDSPTPPPGPTEAPPFPDPEPACVRIDPETCFRPTPGRLGVDISKDGGKTWQPDWVVSDHQWEQLESLVLHGEPREDRLITRQVAVLESADGYTVYAANSVDGIAIRDEQGAWLRMGLPFGTGWGNPEGKPLPSDVPMREVYPLPFVVFGSVLLAGGSFLVMAALRPRRSAPALSSSRIVLATLSALGLLTFANLSIAIAEGQATFVRMDDDPTMVILLGLCLALTATFVPLTATALRWASGVSRARLVLVALVAGLAGGLVGSVPREGVSLRLALGLAVAGGLAALAVRFGVAFRRRPASVPDAGDGGSDPPG